MRLVIDSRLSEIRRATEMVDAFKSRHGLAEEDAAAICVVLDEVLSNAIRHGLAGAASHEIAVTLDLAGSEIVVEVEDGGVAYDPTQTPPPVLGATLEERKEGGIGVALVRAFTDSIEYRRIEGRNRLLMRRRLTGTSPPAP